MMPMPVFRLCVAILVIGSFGDCFGLAYPNDRQEPAAGEVRLDAAEIMDLVRQRKSVSRPSNNRSTSHCDVQSDTDPIDIHSGEFVFSRTDVALGGRGGHALDITFVYQSRSYVNRHWGYGWEMSYDRRVRRLSDGSCYLLRGDGIQHEYAANGTGGWTPPPGVFSSLSMTANGTYQLSHRDGSFETYDIDGNITGIVDRYGNTISFFYDSAGLLPITGRSDFFVNQTTGVLAREYRLTRIVDSVGRHIDFAYGADGRLDSITWLGTRVEYEHDEDGNLVGVDQVGFVSKPTTSKTCYSYVRRNLTEIVNPNGDLLLENHYDLDSDRVVGQTRGSGTTTLAYATNVSGRATTDVVDRKGHRTTYTFDTGGRILKTEQFTDGVPATEPASYVTKYDYDARGLLTRIEYPRGNAVEYVYTAAGDPSEVRVKEAGSPVGVPHPTDIVNKTSHESLYGYSKTATDPLGRVTTFVYDYEVGKPARGEVREVLLPTKPGRPLRKYVIDYDAHGNVTSVVDPVGTRSRLTYDATTGEIASVTRADATASAIVFAFERDVRGNVVATTDPRGHVRRRDLDGYDRPTRVLGPAPTSRETRLRYDATGNVVQIDILDSNVKEARLPVLGVPDRSDSWQSFAFAYTPLNQLESMVGEGGEVLRLEYDANDNVRRSVDEFGRSIDFEYDERDLPTKETDALGLVTAFRYDGNGKLVEIVDAAGNATELVRDGFDRIVRYIYADGSFETLTHDRASNVVQHTTTGGDVFRFLHDLDDRLVRVVGPDDIKSFEYDASGRLIAAENRTARSTFGLDDVGRVVQEETRFAAGVNHATKYVYDAAGNPVRTTYPGDIEVVREYDENDAATFVALIDSSNPTPSGHLGSLVFDYDGFGRRRRIERSNGVSTSFDFNPAGRIAEIASSDTTGVIDRIDYHYDAANRRSAMNDGFGRQDYVYDAIGRLVGVDYPSGHAYDDVAFVLDPVGNILTTTRPSGITTAMANDLNQIATSNGVPFAHDGNGNLTADGTRTIVFDSENQVVSVTRGNDSVDYSYDALGRRVRRRVNGVDSYVVHDGLVSVQDLPPSGVAGQVRVSASGGINDLVLTRLADGRVVFPINDVLGSARLLLDSSANVVEAYAHDVYGMPAFYDGTGNSIPQSAVGNRFVFAGCEWETSAGLFNAVWRSFDSATGRFVQRDPIGYAGDINLYRYATNDPIGRVDPLGLDDRQASPMGHQDIGRLARDELFGDLRQGFHDGLSQLADGIFDVVVGDVVGTLSFGVSDGLQAAAGAVVTAAPNPYGRRGSPAHQARIAEIEAQFVAAGYEVISGGTEPERAVKVPDEGHRFPDLVVEKGDRKVAIQVGRAFVRKCTPVKREREALKSLKKSGVFNYVFFRRYNPFRRR